MTPTHPDRIAFLDTIEANPGDDTGYLAFADWLDENPSPAGMGETANADRARLIRLQVRLKREPDLYRCTTTSATWCPVCGDCTCPEPEDRMDDPDCPLHGDGWHASHEAEHNLRYWEANRLVDIFGRMPSGLYAEALGPTLTLIDSHNATPDGRIVVAEWDRGFLSRVVTTSRAFFDHAPKHAEELALVREVVLTDRMPCESPTGFWENTPALRYMWQWYGGTGPGSVDEPHRLPKWALLHMTRQKWNRGQFPHVEAQDCWDEQPHTINVFFETADEANQWASDAVAAWARWLSSR